MNINTNFFTSIMPLLAKGIDLTLTMKATGDNIVIAVKPQGSAEGLNSIRPIQITNTAQALDEKFFLTITQPLDLYAVAMKEVEDWSKELDSKKEQAKAAGNKKASPGKKATSGKKPAPKKSTGVTNKKSTVGGAKKKPAKSNQPDKPKVDKNQGLHDKYVKAAEKMAAEGKFGQARAFYVNADKAKPSPELKAKIQDMDVAKVQAENKKKEDAKIAANIKRAEDTDVQVLEAQQKGDYEMALKLAEKAQELVPHHSRQSTIAAIRLELLNQKAIIVEPIMAKAEANFKASDFPAFAAKWKEAHTLYPDHPKLEELRKLLIEAVKEPTASYLLGLTPPKNGD